MFRSVFLIGIALLLNGCKWKLMDKQLFSSYLPEMVYVAGGTFNMGSNDGESYEKPVHSVTVKNFYISKFEVTNREYLLFCDQTKRELPPAFIRGQNETHPVINTSYNDATAYGQWISRQTGRKYRLPTEAEWEYAARGGINSKNYVYSGSNTASEVAWYDNTATTGATYPVGLKQVNELGISDMSGNAWEWCSDWIESYTDAAVTNPTGPTSGTLRVQRGGSYDATAKDVRVANRGASTPTTQTRSSGFRLVMDE